MPRQGNPGPRVAAYLRKRAMELATPAVRATTDPLAEWAMEKIRLDGRPFSFEGHEYLRAIYDDTALRLVISKAAQIGGTTWAVLRSLHACLQGLDVGYYFPTRTDVLDFSRSRVAPLLADNPFLAEKIQDTDTVGLKRIGEANLYFRGMKSSVGMKSVPLDMIVFDELDEATPDARAMAQERIAHSDYKRVIELSNPSFPDYGIDAQFERSDQRHWTLKCPGCNTWTALDREFPATLGQEVRIILPRKDGGYYRACPKCGAELDLARGEWVADYPDREVHGYRISQLFSSKVDPGEILEEYRTTRFPGRFYNLKIGIPWADLEQRLDVGTILGCLGEVGEAGKGASVTMGVDTGRNHHVVILRQGEADVAPIEVIHVEECGGFEDLDRLMKAYDVSTCVIDGLPEVHATRAFAERHAGSVTMCFFQPGKVAAATWDMEKHTVHVDRTEAMDASRALVREGRVVISRGAGEVETFAKHLACDVKALEEDPETGAKKYRYVKSAGENHFGMAFTYACLAVQRERPFPPVSAFAPRPGLDPTTLPIREGDEGIVIEVGTVLRRGRSRHPPVAPRAEAEPVTGPH